jgi:hypothetical protein
MNKIIAFAALAIALNALGGCGGGGGSDESDEELQAQAQELLVVQRETRARLLPQRPNVSEKDVDAYDDRAQEILYLWPKPMCDKSQPQGAYEACVFEWQNLTGPFLQPTVR